MKKVEVRGLRLGLKSYPCRVTMGAMRAFKQQTGKEVSELDSGDLEEMSRLVYCCVVSSCRADGVEFDMDFDEFMDRLEPAALNAFYLGMPEGAAEKK